MPNFGDPAGIVDLAATAEESGWDGFFVWDHLQFDAATGPPVHDPWVLLGAIAARTTRVKIGPLVTPVPRRRPWKLAKEVTTLDHLSGGRAILGVGLGVPVAEEFTAFGEPSDRKVHAAMLDEGLELIDLLLRGERVDHDGAHFHVHAKLVPGTVQRPRPPIWVAAMLPPRAGVRRARRWDGIFPIHAELGALTPEMVVGLAAELDSRPGYDIVTALGPDSDVAALEKAGATWAIDGPSSPAESFDTTRRRIAAGPPGR
ncbi:LLM class flavin-dependent oxidoreductase [Actinopolymorpha sp. B11F2]|uniref:LLM class flavin-dependent oxidoreductase n=1 Tax=Actinopolymorpha sp. B11F2 TaxID=3160862 RepID=UPI0032E38E03